MSMTVRAKMKCNEITTSGDPKKPYTRVKLGAVYSNDPKSENRSFADATPSAELNLSIDSGRPAAKAFELGGEYYVDITPVGVPDRTYIKDTIWYAPSGPILLCEREGDDVVRATWDRDKRTVTIGADVYGDMDKLMAATDLTHWKHAE